MPLARLYRALMRRAANRLAPPELQTALRFLRAESNPVFPKRTVTVTDRVPAERVLVLAPHPDDEAMFALAESLRNEFVLKVEGKVRIRPEGTTNRDMPTGEIEVLAQDLQILNTSKTPPFQLDDDEVHDDLHGRPVLQGGQRLVPVLHRLESVGCLRTQVAAQTGAQANGRRRGRNVWLDDKGIQPGSHRQRRPDR